MAFVGEGLAPPGVPILTLQQTKGESAAFKFCGFAFSYRSIQIILHGRGKPLPYVHAFRLRRKYAIPPTTIQPVRKPARSSQTSETCPLRPAAKI